LEGVVRERIVNVSPAIEVCIRATLAVVFEGFAKHVRAIITAWNKAVVTIAVAISIGPLEWIFPESIDWINESVTVII
jgi:hypothetical protein